MCFIGNALASAGIISENVAESSMADGVTLHCCSQRPLLEIRSVTGFMQI